MLKLQNSPRGIGERLPQAAVVLALLPLAVHLKARGGVDRPGDAVPLLRELRIHSRLLLIHNICLSSNKKEKKRQHML